MRAPIGSGGNRGSAVILLTDTAAQLGAAFFDRPGYPAARCTFRPAFTLSPGLQNLRYRLRTCFHGSHVPTPPRWARLGPLSAELRRFAQTTMYDLIGDIHGHADAQQRLLKKLGYSRQNGVYRQPERLAMFLCDFIDRGPQIRET